MISEARRLPTPGLSLVRERESEKPLYQKALGRAVDE